MVNSRLLTLTIVLALAGSLAAQLRVPFEAQRDIDYRPLIEVGDNKDRLDVFMPPGARKVPVLVFFHGGALMAGDKVTADRPDYVPHRFVPEGIGVVMANYRLSPSVRHPTHLEDAAAAVAWVFENIADFGGDPEHVYISGHSAGGYLAAMLALDKRYLGLHGIQPAALRGTIPISPFLDVEEVAPVRDKAVWGVDEAVWKEASPMSYLAKAGPMLLIVADGDADWRKAQNVRVRDALAELGTPVDYVEAPDRDHFTVMAHISAEDDVAAKSVVDFIGRHSGPVSDH